MATSIASIDTLRSAMRYSGLDNQRGLKGSSISTTIASPSSPARRVYLQFRAVADPPRQSNDLTATLPSAAASRQIIGQLSAPTRRTGSLSVRRKRDPRWIR
jgi:hypothetical protein